MRGGPKTLIVAVVALLLAAGLVACGGGDDSSSATEAGAPAQAGGGSSNDASSKDEGSSAKEGKAGKEGSSNGSDQGETSGDSGGEGSGNFVPRQHSDSGGGSEQFKTKGGDNSIQEFGSEAAGSEFEAVATVLHNFLDARAVQDWAATCEFLANPLTESLEKLAAQAKRPDASCGEVLEGLVNPAAKQSIEDEADEADVRSVRIEGDQAFVVYTANGGTAMTLPMASEDGSWRVTSLAGTPLS